MKSLEPRGSALNCADEFTGTMFCCAAAFRKAFGL
jgi:hypothetical protein